MPDLLAGEFLTMSVAVGLLTADRRVVIGADARFTGDCQIFDRATKAWELWDGAMLIGVVGVPGIGHAAREVANDHGLAHGGYAEMLAFARALHDHLKLRGALCVREGRDEMDGRLLVGYGSEPGKSTARLFVIDSAFGVLEQPLAAIGCGAPYALGALWMMEQAGRELDESAVRDALRAAAAHDCHVAEPFTVLRTRNS